MFAALGTTKALSAGLPIIPSLFIGTIAAVGGGLLRDLLLNLPIAVMHVGSFYAVAALVGSGVLVGLLTFGIDVTLAGVICVVVTTCLRLLSLFFGWSLPEQRALDRLKRRKRREVEETVEAIRTQTIQFEQGLPDIDPEGPNHTPRA
ncbi:MAG: trimeric intracellular cation channel family protein [Canibacter sp.]